LIFFSARFGSLAAKFGPRWFMAAGPLLMAVGVLWFARIPADSTAWRLQLDAPGSYLPPLSYFTDFLPGSILFGLGIMMLVAPLTTALMTSVPVRNSGVASAINNAISRVGPQLAGALIFVFLTANFYAYLASRLSANVNDPSFRAAVSPLNKPLDPHLVSVVRDASTSSFHIAMVLGAALLVLGAIVNAIGIQNAAARKPAEAETKPADTTAEAHA
jgi:MFS family permease